MQQLLDDDLVLVEVVLVEVRVVVLAAAGTGVGLSGVVIVGTDAMLLLLLLRLLVPSVKAVVEAAVEHVLAEKESSKDTRREADDALLPSARQFALKLPLVAEEGGNVEESKDFVLQEVEYLWSLLLSDGFVAEAHGSYAG